MENSGGIRVGIRVEISYADMKDFMERQINMCEHGIPDPDYGVIKRRGKVLSFEQELIKDDIEQVMDIIRSNFLSVVGELVE